MAEKLEFVFPAEDEDVLNQHLAEQQDTETEKKGPFH